MTAIFKWWKILPLCWLVFCQLDISYSYLRGGTSVEEVSPEDLAISRQACGGIFLISDWWGRAQPIVGGATPGLVVPSFIIKQVEQAIGEQASKQHSSVASASAPASKFLLCWSFCSDFLRWWTVIWKYELKKPFPPQVALVWCCITARVTNPKTLHKQCPSTLLYLSIMLSHLPMLEILLFINSFLYMKIYIQADFSL